MPRMGGYKGSGAGGALQSPTLLAEQMNQLNLREASERYLHLLLIESVVAKDVDQYRTLRLQVDQLLRYQNFPAASATVIGDSKKKNTQNVTARPRMTIVRHVTWRSQIAMSSSNTK